MINKKVILLTYSLAHLFTVANAAALPLTGFYKTIDDKTGNAKSIVRLYEYKVGDESKLGGRIVALFDANGEKISETMNAPVRVAEKVEGSPHMAGMDIIWNMKYDERDKEYSSGKILDPKSGSVYSSVIWPDKKDPTLLNVRGKIGPFGRTQTWHVFDEKDLPKDVQGVNVKDWTPKVIK